MFLGQVKPVDFDHQVERKSLHFFKGKPYKGVCFEAKNLILEYFSLEYSCGAQTQDRPGTATLYSVHGGGSLLGTVYSDDQYGLMQYSQIEHIHNGVH